MKKRGSHIDIVISFVIFIVFLGFLYSIISPAKIQENKEAILNSIEKEVKDKLSANLTTSSVTMAANTKYCYKINNTINSEGLNVIVKDENNNPVKFDVYEDPQGVIKEYLRIDGRPENEGEAGKTIFKVYHSEEKFNGLPLDAQNCFDESGGFVLESTNDPSPVKQVGLIRTEKYIFESKVKSAFTDEDTYNALKESLNIPYGSEFSFNFTFNDGTSVAWENKKVSTNTYAREVPVQYINEEANITLGYLNIKVW